MGQKLDRVGQHLAPRRDDFADDGAGDAVVGHLKRGFDHREDKALDAEPVAPDIAPLGLQQSFLQMVAPGIVGQEVGEMIMRQAKEALVMPERVVGVEGDGGKRGHGAVRGDSGLCEAAPWRPIRRLHCRAGWRRDQSPDKPTLFSPGTGPILWPRPEPRESRPR